MSARPKGQEPDRTGQDPRRHARPVRTPEEPWIPSGQAHAEELGPGAPTVAHLAEIEDADAIAAGGVAAASESDAEAGVGAAPEHLEEEVLPEFSVDTTFSLDEATVVEEEEGLEDELEPRDDRARDQSERRRPVP